MAASSRRLPLLAAAVLLLPGAPAQAATLGPGPDGELVLLGTPGPDALSVVIDPDGTLRLGADGPLAPPDGCDAADPRTVRCPPQTLRIDTGAGDDTVVVRAANAPGRAPVLASLGTGNDLWVDVGPGGGQDVDGGPGRDTVTYAARSDSVTVDLRPGHPSGAAGEGDHLASFERGLGGGGNDTLYAASGVTRGPRGPETTGSGLAGGGGNDLLVGGAGPDVLVGGSGSDRLEGAGGDDALYGGEEQRAAAVDGADVLLGGPGDDRLEGDDGPDTLDGGPGDDVFDLGTYRASFDDDDLETDVHQEDGASETPACGPGEDLVIRTEARDTVGPDCEAAEAGGTGLTLSRPRPAGPGRVALLARATAGGPYRVDGRLAIRAGDHHRRRLLLPAPADGSLTLRVAGARATGIVRFAPTGGV